MPACRTLPRETVPTEQVELDAFSIRVPIGEDWERHLEDGALTVSRRLGREWALGFTLDLKAPPRFDEPTHPYDLLALVRMRTFGADREDRFDVLEHSEELIRHEGMDCALFQFAMKENAPAGPEAGFAIILGRGLICAHPTDPHRIADAVYVIRSLDGRLLAVDEEVGNAFLESIRWNTIDESAPDTER